MIEVEDRCEVVAQDLPELAVRLELLVRASPIEHRGIGHLPAIHQGRQVVVERVDGRHPDGPVRPHRHEREPDDRLPEQVRHHGTATDLPEVGADHDPGRPSDDTKRSGTIDDQVGVVGRQAVEADPKAAIRRREHLLDQVDLVEFHHGAIIAAVALDRVASGKDRGQQEEQADHCADRCEEAHAEDLPHGVIDASACARSGRGGRRRRCGTVGALGYLVDDRIGMGHADEDRLVRARRQRHALSQHGVEETGVGRLVGALGVLEVDSRSMISTHHPDQRPDDRKAGCEPGRSTGIAHQRGEPCRTRGEQVVHVGVEQVERRQPGGRRDRVAGQCAGVEHRTERRQRFHDPAAPTNGADRQPATDHLAERGEVGPHAIGRLGTAEPEPESGDHLVEDQHRADAVTLVSKPLQETGLRFDHTHVGGDRFDDHACHRPVEVWHLVVRNDHRFGHRSGRYARSSREPQRGDTTATGRQQRVGGAVEVAVEDDDPVAPGVPAGQPDRRAGGFGARVHEPDLLAGPDPLADRLRQLHLARRRRAIRRSTCCGVRHRCRDRRVSVSEDHRSVTLNEVEVLVALDVPHPGALGPRHHIRAATNRRERPDRRVDPTRDHLRRAPEELVVRGQAVAGAHRRRASGGTAAVGIAQRDHAEVLPEARSTNHLVR